VQKQKLACDLVKDQLGDLVYQVLHHLVHRGRASLPELARATQLPPGQLKNCLLSLLQHNCVDAYKVRTIAPDPLPSLHSFCRFDPAGAVRLGGSTGRHGGGGSEQGVHARARGVRGTVGSHHSPASFPTVRGSPVLQTLWTAAAKP
jgi:hypothetical protein